MADELITQLDTAALETLEREAQAEIDRRARDQDAAVEAAFVAGTLPEEDRRTKMAAEPTNPPTHPTHPTHPTLATDDGRMVSVLELTHEVDGQRVKTTMDGTFAV